VGRNAKVKKIRRWCRGLAASHPAMRDRATVARVLRKLIRRGKAYLPRAETTS